MLAWFLGINPPQLWLELEKHFDPSSFPPVKVQMSHKGLSIAQKAWIFQNANMHHTLTNTQAYQDLVEVNIRLDHLAGFKITDVSK